MSENRYISPFLLIALLLVSSMAPLAAADATQSTGSGDNSAVYDAGGVVIGDITEFNPDDGR